MHTQQRYRYMHRTAKGQMHTKYRKVTYVYKVQQSKGTDEAYTAEQSERCIDSTANQKDRCEHLTAK